MMTGLRMMDMAAAEFMSIHNNNNIIVFVPREYNMFDIGMCILHTKEEVKNIIFIKNIVSSTKTVST